MVGIHGLAVDLAGPMRGRSERTHLAGGQDEVVIALEEFSHGLIPGGASEGCGHNVGSAKLEQALDLELRFLLEQCALGRVVVEMEDSAPRLPGRPAAPIVTTLVAS